MPFHPMIYYLNPKITARYKETFVDMNKTDPLDVLAIADFARAQKITTEPWRGAQFLVFAFLLISAYCGNDKTTVINKVGGYRKMVRRKKESPPSIPKVSLHRRQTRVLTVTQINYEISKLEFQLHKPR